MDHVALGEWHYNCLVIRSYSITPADSFLQYSYDKTFNPDLRI